ncbi:adenylate/guanylate cyclase domain-containing protein [Allomesorhizobium camelthorni]|uniref:Adenylate/guanylate cyclase domain-containing protein n=1 Tax=Allomesorhizobium camelthorni TaxID=475069 RepID=A0A6G4WCR1_9HYPH|nr:adenylate/guanylate cyclase domain-containing protein [Mesorhizobium camelthorni]NGO52585.1 adenylate/guanylate cyclase domain-containing protein [Mesorhizobium camelthorni]
MSITNADVSTILMDKVADWLSHSSLVGDDLETMVRGFCERLAAAGLPLARVHLSFSMLHPLYDALGFTWERGTGMHVEGFRKKPGETAERFLRSPYYHLLSNNLDHLRRRIDPEGPSEFPIFDDLKLLGVTDYLAFKHWFDGDNNQGMLGSWSTDNPGGFSENMIAALLRVQNHLAVAAKMAVLSKLADNMLTTYLGGDAGKRVLNGQIKRGEGDTIRAALVMADMRGSTMLAEREGREVYIETLNRFFDAIAAPFNRRGGQIMSFLGDGFLAVYPCDRHREPSEIACRAALAAAFKASARMADLNEERKQKGLAEIGYGIGLHVGNVMFGNVGLTDRLTFSAFGSAVNEVQRLQVLTKKYPHRLIASKDFATYTGGGWVTLGKEKLAGVRQKLTILHPDVTDIEMTDEDGFEVTYDGMSDAEQLMLLIRGGGQSMIEVNGGKKLQ